MIQVCAHLDASETVEREMRALWAAEEHPQASPRLIRLTSDPVRGLPDNVTRHSAVECLLGAV